MRIYIIIALLIFGSAASAQENYLSKQKFNSEEREVLQTALDILEGIRSSDPELFLQQFIKNPDLAVVYKNRKGEDVFQKNDIAGFAQSVAKEKTAIWDEVIWNIDITIDGKLAVLTCDYAFYLGKEFHHCGMDVFVMHKIDGNWKVFHLSDTRREENCEVPEKLRKGRDL